MGTEYSIRDGRGAIHLLHAESEDERLDMATVEGLDAKLATLTEGQRNLTKLVEGVAKNQRSQASEVTDLKVRVSVLETMIEERDRAEEERQSKAWQELAEKWVIRIALALGTVATALQALG